LWKTDVCHSQEVEIGSNCLVKQQGLMVIESDAEAGSERPEGL
jgi:hypothetical protein